MGPINKNRSFKRGSSVLLVLLGSYITVMVLSIIAQFGARRAIPSSVVAFHCPIKGRKPFRRRLLDSTPSSSTSRWMELVDSVVNPPDDPNRQEIEKALKRIPTNKELVERRLALNRAKREARERGIQHRVSRNLHIKRLLHSDTTTTTTINTDIDNKDDTQESAATSPSIPPLYAVKVWVDDDLRETLRLTGREKRGRVFIEAGTNGTSTLSGLKGELFAFFRALRKDTFLLTATLPRIAPDGTILSPEDKDQAMVDSWPIETDNDVRKTFEAADEIFRNIMVTHLAERGDASILQRPSIQINVLKDPNAPPPPPIPSYLINMPEPAESESMTMLSFYAFPPSGIADPEAFAFNLKVKWKPFQAVGRVYVAQEGVNAQMGVPTNVLKNFMDCCRSVSELGKYMENDINIDPKPLSRSEFAVAGVPTNGQPAPPFRNLHIRVRNQVVADGLTKSLDWQSAGYDMPPLEWHETLKDAREKKKKMMRGPTTMSKDDVEGNLPIILDCRNTYETGVGIFEGAEPLETENFRESWDVLKKRLADTPKDAPIMTYCTGGIRCVKVGAYLTQELGFTNVSRLAGGIIAYDRVLNEKQGGEESMFKGANFVFDGRLGRQITEDALGTCITCGAETSLVSNCRNDNCHKRMVQCENCRTGFHGTCSSACKNRVLNGAMAPRRLADTTVSAEVTLNENTDRHQSVKYTNLDEYSMGHSSPVPSIYKEIELNTQSHLASGSHMVSGPSQGRFLMQLASMTRYGRILEVGTFTGYATACLLEGARNVGQILESSSSITGNAGPYVLTMERDDRAFTLAAAHLQVVGEHGFGNAAAEAACAFRGCNLDSKIDDLVSITIDDIATCELLRVTDALATVEAIASGIDDAINLTEPFDMVFVDADKTRLLEYVEVCLTSDRLLRRGGLIVVDNVLWKGLVLEAGTGDFTSVQDQDDTEKTEIRKNRRARKLATIMHHFNEGIAKDDRLDVLVLPMRDGLSVIRKK